MIEDIATLLWKEMKELIQQQGKMRGGAIGMLFFIGVFGVFMPLQTGPEWVNSVIPLIYWSWIPFLLVSSVIADSFAGERERHTLETLLASRLSDKAILFGKIAAAIAYGWGLTMVCVLLSIVSVNLAFSEREFLFYPPKSSLAIFSFSLLIAGLATGIGILVSLRAATVRQAQQTFSVAFFLLFIPMFIVPLLPEEHRIKIMEFLMKANVEQLAIAAGVLLLVLDGVLIWMAMLRFKRSRLILD